MLDLYSSGKFFLCLSGSFVLEFFNSSFIYLLIKFHICSILVVFIESESNSPYHLSFPTGFHPAILA